MAQVYLPYSSSKSSSFLRIEDLNEVLEVLRRHQYSGVNSYQLGLSLGLLSRTLDKIEREHSQNVDRCLLECLRQWLNQADNVKSKGGPTWYALIKALRSIGENTVADGIHNEKHPACLILSSHQSESVITVLPQLGLLLSKEGLIGDMLLLPTTSKELMSRVEEAVCVDHHNLVKFAIVLKKLESTGDAILTEYRKVFTDTSLEIVSRKTTQETERGVVVPIPVTLKSQFAGIRAKYASMFYDVRKAMTTPAPSAVCVEDLKSYLRSGYPYLKLSQCENIDKVIDVISDESSLIDVDILEAVVNKFENKQAKSYITKYKNDVENFCESTAPRLILNEQFSSPPILLCETATFLVDRLIDDETFKDIEILVNIAFRNKAKIVVIKEGNSFSITCSFPLTLSHILITNALQNIEQLKERGVYQLTIGYCTVYKREAKEGTLQQSTISSVYTCKGGMEQLMVAQSIQLIEKEEEITSLNKDMKQLTKKNKCYEEKITLLNEQVTANSQFNTLKENNDDIDVKTFLKEESGTALQHTIPKSNIDSLHTFETSTQTDDDESLSQVFTHKVSKEEKDIGPTYSVEELNKKLQTQRLMGNKKDRELEDLKATCKVKDEKINAITKNLEKTLEYKDQEITELKKNLLDANAELNSVKKHSEDRLREKIQTQESSVQTEITKQTFNIMIQLAIEELHKDFVSLLQGVRHTLDINIQENNNLLQDIAIYCQEYCHISTLQPLTNIYDLFQELRPHYDFLHCELIEAIVKQFLNQHQLHTELNQYVHRVREFLKSHTLFDLKTALLQTGLIPYKKLLTT